MYTLGINAAYHDSSACLVKDGIVLAAAEEERFTGVKHGKRPVPFTAYELPFHAIDFCLGLERLRLIDIDHVAYSFDPFLLPGGRSQQIAVQLPLEPSRGPSPAAGTSVWDPLFLSYIVNAPRQLADGAPHHLKERFQGADKQGPYRWHFVEHHLAHAASAFYASPFNDAAILTIDGRGERATTSYGYGSGAVLDLFKNVAMPNSLGLFYEKITSYLGFLHSSDEYKVMALASFGKPAYLKEFRNIIMPGTDGDYAVRDVDLQAVFGPARERGEPFKTRDYDIARSLQAVLEETVLEISHWLFKRTGTQNLCMAGGVALNCVMNSALRDEGPFSRIWVQPAAGDAGTALGAALSVDLHERGNQKRCYCMEHAYLGPSYSDREIETALRKPKLDYCRMTDIPEQIAGLLAEDRVIGWFQGRMEFGPRALGARSLLASPQSASMQTVLNEIKDREDFRPVAPVVLEEEAAAWFTGNPVSPFMLFIHDVRPEKKAAIPAVCHVDGTARIQTLRREHNGLLYDVIKSFQKRTGVPLLINTSFNTRGKPIVCSPRDAIECFYTSPLDALAIGSFLLKKRGV